MEPEWRVEVVRPPSVGGQHVGVTNYPIRVTHVPSGLQAICGWERSQHKNRQIAMEMVEWALITLDIPYAKA
jgi:protein subunit release factor A